MKNNIMSKEASRATSLILTFVMIMAMFLGALPSRVLAAGTGNIYYVDSVNGSDSSSGTTPSTAWKTLDKVNNTTFTAGDKILLVAGSSWTGQLYPKGSGTDGNPIIIDMYDPTGTGIKPKIDANGTVNAAMRLNNQEYWEINNLELTNSSTTAGDLRGVYVTAEDYGTADHIYVSNCYIHDVNGIVKWKGTWGWDESKRNGGIIFDVRPGTMNGAIKTNFNDIKIINNHIKDTSMIPIAVWQNNAWGWLTRSSATDTDWHPNTNVVYRGNYVEFQNNANQACAILMYSVDGGLAEYNTVASSHTSGIETGCSNNVTFQYNEIGNITVGAGGSDSCAIDQDEQVSNATFQYNYLHNSGVGLLVYGVGFGSNFTFRYNIMQDFTKHYMELYQQNLSGTAAVYNNVLYNSKAVSVPFTEGSMTGGSATIKNNIFYGLGTFVSRSNVTYDYNTYYGMTTTPTDAHKITSDPKFVNGGTGGTGTYSGGPAFSTVSGYQLQPGSPCINAGTSIASNGGIDFAGNAIYKGLPDMGAFEYIVDASSTILVGYTKDPYGNVVDGATVSVTAGGTTYSGTSDTSGFYSIEGIPAGSGYTINATKSNYQDTSVSNVTVVAGDITKQDISMTSLSTTGSISGTVTDYSGNVISGATVTTTVNSQDYSASTDSQGVYTINDVPIGAANAVIASKSGYANGQVITTVQPGSTVKGVNISLTKLNPPVYFINDNFDYLATDTSLTSTNTASAWTVALANSGSSVKAESTEGATGEAAHIKKSTSSGTGVQTGISKTGLNLTGIVTVEARISTDETSTTKTYWSIPTITDSTGKRAATINVSGGIVSSYIGGTNKSTGVSLSNTSRVWHTIRVVLNTNSQTYSLYIDNMDTPLTDFNNVSFREAATNINTVNFYADAANLGNVYIDYVRVNSDLPSAENNTDLSSLSLSSGALTQLDAFSYKAEDVPNFVDKVTVTPTADSIYETINVNGTPVQSGQPSQEISLSEGDNTINVETTAEDGTTKQNYTISVYRVTSDEDGFLKSLTISQGTLNPSFDYDVYDYNVSVPYETNTITLQPTASVSGAKIYVNNALVTSGQTSQNISLNPGDNTIDVIVSPASGAGAYGKSYKILVNRDSTPSSPAEVAGVKVTPEDGQLLITWIDPADSDFDHVEISGTGIMTQTVNKGAQSAMITGLTNGNIYSITLKTVDITDNKSPGVNVSGKPVADGTVLVNEMFDSQTSPENFGFYYYTNVSNGMLNVTSGSPSYQASVKTFNSAIRERKSLDLTFDWKTGVSASGNKTGLEFRDDAGNLIFAICGLASEFRYSYTGAVSNSTTTSSLEPTWIKTSSFDPSLWYTVRLQMNFATQKLSYSIVTRGDSPTTIASGTDIPISATNLNKMVACDYYGVGVQSIDNFELTGTTDEVGTVNVLQGKTIYAFGDSIVYGHVYGKSFIDYVAGNEEMTVTKYAVNGATIGNKSDYASRIIEQVNGASTVEPDIIVFDGLTNDAEAIFTKHEYEIGEITTGFDPQQFDTNTFAGSFENIVYQMKAKWSNAKLVYVAVHKMVSRDWGTQVELQALAKKICQKWGVTVSDLFNESEFDTRIADEQNKYTFNALTTSGYPGTNGSGTHPNLEGVRLFYVPMVSTTLMQVITVDKSELETLYNVNKEKEQGSYTVESWQVFMQALTKVQEVLADDEVTQTAVDEAKEQLEAAVNGLTEGAIVDKLQLETLYNLNKDRGQGNYTNESWQAFTQALTKAQEVLADNQATQTAVNEAKEQLETAVNGLAEGGTIDKLQLEILHNSNKDKEQGNYTNESWAAFTQALIKAQEVLADGEATQVAVDEAKEQLEAAVNGLTEGGTVDKLQLETLYNSNKNKEQGNYTNESWAAFTQALIKAQEVLADGEATQVAVDEAKEQLEAAVNGLTGAGVEVTGANVSAGNGQLVITWTDPADSDFDHVEISGVGIMTQAVNKGEQSVTITDLINGSTYNIILKTVDALGNKSAGVSVSGTPAAPDTTENKVTDVTIDQNNNVSVIKGESQQFTATVNGTGSFDDSVEWSITTTGISTDTKISNTGKLTVSPDENLDSLTVRATSAADNNIYADISVNLLPQLSDAFTIEYNLTHATIIDIDVNTPEVTTGSAVTITFAADDGYKLPDSVSVDMDGNDSPSYDYNSDTGILDITGVTGDLTIELVAEKIPVDTTEPTVTTIGASSIGKKGAVLTGVVSQGSEPIIGQGFEWKKTSGGDYEQVTGTLDNTSLKATLTGLSKNTRYTIRAFVITDTGTYYGDEKTFKTDRDSSSSSSSSSSSGSTSSNSSTKVETTENNNAATPIVNNNTNTIGGGWNQDLGVWKYVKNGQPLNGWNLIDGSWYFMDPIGVMQTGWQQASDTWYLLKDNGAMATGWQQVNGTWYLFKDNGAMATGWQQTEGKWYYLYSNGAMASNTVIDGYKVDASGAWV